MVFKLILTLFTVLVLTACASPEQLESDYNKMGSKCASIGKSMVAVESCLDLEFRDSKYQDNIVKDHQSCKPYWRFPFVSSCGGIKIIYDQNKTVAKWFACGHLDGV